jgi:hypothetical protein
LMRGDSTTNINTCEQLEERHTWFDHLQMDIMTRRVIDETPWQWSSLDLREG